MIVFIKDSFSYKRRLDLEVLDVECIWIELTLPKNKRILVGLFYRPPNLISELTDRIESSIDLAVNTGIKDIIITGDFNLNPSMPQASRTLNGIICKNGLTQCIENPTHYTEHSWSIIDLILLRNNNSLTKCGVANPFLEQNTRYHCPVFAKFKFTKPKTASFSRHVWLYDAANFDLLRQRCKLI